MQAACCLLHYVTMSVPGSSRDVSGILLPEGRLILTSPSSCNSLADKVQRAGACTSALSTEMVTRGCRMKHTWRIETETKKFTFVYF